MKSHWIKARLFAAVLSVAPACMPQSQTLHNGATAGKLARAPGTGQSFALSEQSKGAPAASAASAESETRRFLEMPLDFEMNNGQAPSGYAFVAHGPSYALGISSSGLALSLHRPDYNAQTAHTNGLDSPTGIQSSALRLNLVGGARDSQISGVDPQSGRSNYFIGNDPARWQRNVPHFGRVKVAGIYPGIDAVFYGNRQQLEYDFAVAPGADPGRIRLQAEGAKTVTLDSSGNAILHTNAGEVELHRPVAYQEIAGVRHDVESTFQLIDGKLIQFQLGDYDHNQQLVIDPVLAYGVELGGSNGNAALGVAIDNAGDAYVSGFTCSADFPSTAGNFGTLPGDASKLADCSSAFVVKMDPTASSLLYSDFFGGKTVFSAGGKLTVDSSGDVFLTGTTGASDFPTVSNIGPTSLQNCGIESAGEICPAGFILKLSPDGSQILFSSLLGGSQVSLALQAKLNPVTGDLVVLGDTNSSNFLPAPTTLQTTFGGGTCASSNPCFDAFVLGLNPTTGALRYGTFIGGSSNDWGASLAFDINGNIYVTGGTHSPSITSLGAPTHTYAPAGGATASGGTLYVAKLDLSGNQLTSGYLTLIQGDGDTAAGGIAVDGSGNSYVAGASAALHLPVTTGVFQSTNKGTYGSSCLWPKIAAPFLPSACGAGLVGKLDSTGALSFLTYLGGTGQDTVQSIGLDSSNNIWLGGATSSNDFPVSADKYGGVLSGFYSPFLAEMSNNGTQLPFATLIGGGPGGVTDLTVDANNNVYVAGTGNSGLTTPGVYAANPQVFSPALVQKWSPGTAPSISLSALYFNFPQTGTGASSAPQTVTVQNTGTVAMQLSVQLVARYPGDTPSDFPESTTCGTSLAAGASCTITAAFEPGPPSPICVATPNCNIASRVAAIVIANNATQGTQTLTLGGTVTIGPGFSFSPNPVVFPAQPAGTTSAQLFTQGESQGDSLLAISSIALSGPNATDFKLQLTGVGGPDCVTNPVPPGSLCNLGITFSPPANATGTRTATLTFTDTAADSPQSIPVSGTVASANFLNISPLNLSPNFPVAFGTSTTAVLTLQNPSTTSSVQVTSLGITGTNAGDYSAAPSNCGNNGALPMTVPANSTCYVTVTFNPVAGASGARVATLTLQTTPVATGLPTVSLSGDAVTNSQPSMSFFIIPDPMNFGGLQVGETSNNASVLFTIYNKYPIPCAGGATTCGAPLIVNSITPGLSDYSLTNASPGCTPLPATIASGGNCTYAVVFKPAQAGLRNTTLTIQSNDPQGTVQLPIFGTGLSLPLGELLGSNLDFGQSAIGVASPPLTTTLKNVGPANLVISGVTATVNYAITANTCTGTIPPKGTCSVSVTFTPPSAGYFSGTLTISDNDPIGPQQIVTLAGTGATGPQLRITPPTLNFGNQQVNKVSPAQTITLTSTGSTALTFPANAIRSSQDFILHATTCGPTLPFGASCTASIQYSPVTVIGFPELGSLLITDNATGSPQPVYMQGTATQGVGLVSTTTLASSLNPSTSGQSVTFTATVTGPSGNTTVPTGTVTFYVDFAAVGSGTLNASGQATYSTSTLSAATHNVTATYNGDSNFVSSTSGFVIQVVNAATLPATTTALISSANPSTSGQSVILTATVTGPSGNTTVPTGTVTFMDGANSLGTGSLNGLGQATYSTSSLSVASHSITAVYGGSTTFAGSTSAILTQVVNAATLPATTTAVISSANPSASGQSVMFTATVTGPSGNTTVPTGTITFFDGATSMGGGTLNGSGQAAFTTSSLSDASHSITAVYAGSSAFAGSTSAILTQVVNKATSTTAVVSSVNPSTSGQSVTFTATVAAPTGDAIVPTGTVNILDGTTTLGNGTLNSAGVATYSTSALGTSSHSITAVYAGDTNFTGSNSTALAQVVNKATSTTAVVSSVNPSASGQSVIFTATVAAPSGNPIIPTGSVNFLDGATTLGSGTLNAAGFATYSTSALSAGSHSITAVYAGDTNFTGSTSTALSQVVNPPVKLTSTTVVTSSLNPSGQGQSVTFTSVVTGPTGNATIPTGTVTFTDGSSTLGTGTLNGSGQATYNTSSLSTGSHSITAVYGGDTNFAGSTSSALTQTVNTPSYTVSFNPTSLTVTGGSPGITTITVTPAYGFSQQVSFACSGLPTFTTCSFSPANVTPNGTIAATSTLTIATNVAAASLTRPAPFDQRKSPLPSQALLALILLGLGGVVRSRRSWKGWMLSLALIAALGMIASGCGGKSSNTGGSGATTPKGTSTITVTATSGSLSQPATFTLTVQ